MLNRVNTTVLLASQKGLSPETAQVLCRKEIEKSSNQLLSAGYQREDFRLNKIVGLPEMVDRMLAG